MRIGGLGFLALILAAPLPAQDAARTADIDEAFQLVGVRSMLEALPSHVNEMTLAAVAQLPQDQRHPFEPLIKDARREFLHPDTLYRQLRSYFVKHYDAGKMATFLALERTPSYRTMNRLEAGPKTPTEEAAKHRFEANLKEDPPEAKRLDILRRLDEAMNTTGVQLRIVMGIVNAMSEGLGAQAPAGLDTKSADFTAKVRPVLANLVLMQNLYVYRNADNDDLEEYIAAAGQPAVQWFNRNLQSALLATAGERAARLSEDIKTKLSQTAK